MNFKKILFFLYLLCVFSFLLFINLFYLEGIPHVPDDAAYLFMAKEFASGHIIQPIPVSPQHFDFFPGILTIERGTWLFQYPFGHPFLLAIGVLIGFPNLIPPLVGTLTIFLLFLIARKLYHPSTATFLLFLPFFSPFFLSNSASFMGHTSAAFYLSLSLFFLIKSQEEKHPLLFGFLSGICIGLLFNTRPLTALPFIILFFLIFLIKKQLKISRMYIIGFSLLFLCWLVYNFVTTGSFTTSQYYSINQGMIGIELDKISSEYLTKRFENIKILFQNLGPMLFGWPQVLTYTLLFFPLLVKKSMFWDKIFFLSLFTLPITYFFYNGTFLMYGPRFWYEITPFVFLLISRSFSILFSRQKVIAISLFFILGILAIGVLFSVVPTTNPDIMSPRNLQSLKTFNYVDSRIMKEIHEENIHNAVVFISECRGNWWCYGSVFPQNNPTLTTDNIFAKDLGEEKNKKLLIHFPNRHFYIADYDKYTLTPITL